jgi:hypothetical protein
LRDYVGQQRVWDHFPGKIHQYLVLLRFRVLLAGCCRGVQG